MLTDGALRMLVLLHFHLMGLGAIQIAYLFVIYEIAGVITNLLAGWIASKFGLALILYIGLLFQITDDLIDYKGITKNAGKKTKKDQKKGKATLISLLGYKNTIKYINNIKNNILSVELNV